MFTILVADKNKNVREFLRRELAAEGYEVVVARDGAQIMAEIDREDRLDLLVLDLEMRDADSSKIFEKSQKRSPPLPVIIHTFLTEESERDLSVNKGNIYIEKAAISTTSKQPSPICLRNFTPIGLLMPDLPTWHNSNSPVFPFP